MMPESGRGSDRSTLGSGQFLGAGVQLAGAILLFVFLGQWLDDRLGTEPWLLLIGAFVGAGAGFHSLYRQLVTKPREKDRGRAGGKVD